MQLYYQTHSPFARKVLVFAIEAGLEQRLEVLHQETSPVHRNELVSGQNPLGKVPVLLRPAQVPLVDSAVICDYLDTLHRGPKLVPAEGERRWNALRLQAVASGLAETGIALRWEMVRRPEHLRYSRLADGYREKLEATYAWLDTVLDIDGSIHVGHIAVATALDWILFRDLPDFRDQPRLAGWFESFAARPSMRQTPLSGETVD